MKQPARIGVLLALAGALCSGAAQACWERVGLKYGIHPHLLHAIAKTESGLNPNAVNRANVDGSRDVGLMQINSLWFPRLAAMGISEQMLYQPCVNLEVGAWILAQNMSRFGPTWQAVGAYNAVSPERRERYARAVWRNLPPPLREP